MSRGGVVVRPNRVLPSTLKPMSLVVCHTKSLFGTRSAPSQDKSTARASMLKPISHVAATQNHHSEHGHEKIRSSCAKLNASPVCQVRH